MRSWVSLVLYLVFIFIGGALAAPWLYHGAHWLAARTALFQSLRREPFYRYVHRCFMVIGLVGFYPLLRGMGIRSWADLGFGRQPRWGRRVGAGFALGFVSLAVVAVLAIAAGGRQWDGGRTWEAVGRHLIGAGLTAVVVAPIEEVFFRGAAFGGLRRVVSWGWALAISSLLYAWVHFFERPTGLQEVGWLSGLQILPRMFHGLIEIDKLVPGFLNLALAGGILAWAYQRYGDLYFSMGLHGGWIFWLKSYGFLTTQRGSSMQWLWGTGKLIDGWVATAVLLVVGWIFARYAPPSGASETSDLRFEI